jgi:hypothetical protein
MVWTEGRGEKTHKNKARKARLPLEKKYNNLRTEKTHAK